MINKPKNMVVLRLEGILQSWGESAKWNFRDSGTMPTKSGIVGLLGCAMGLERNSEDLVELNRNISIAVRADRSGVRFVDFQTVTGHPLISATGKARSKSIGNTIISSRAYLQDACFTVFISASDIWLQRIVDALRSPKWCLYLGRKNCVPNRPVLDCDFIQYQDFMDAFRHYPVASRAVYPMPYECDALSGSEVVLQRPDSLIGASRQFGLRNVCRGVITEEDCKCI